MKPATDPNAAAEPQSQPTLAKEYVYAGGRLVATEETPAPSGPSITSLNPSFAYLGNTISLTITGSNLAGASSVNFTPSTIVSNISSTSNQVTATVSINTPTGPRSVSVTTPSGTSGTLPFEVRNPEPVASSISPNTITENTAFTLTVNGTGFINGSVIRINGVGLATTFSTEQILTATVSGQTAGLKDITVFNPAPGGGESNKIKLTVNPAISNPVPHIGNISPLNVTVGSGAFTLTVNSDNSTFRNNSVVRINDSPRTTHFQSQNQVTADIPASDVATVGVKTITVFTPSPGGGISNQAPLIVGGGTVGIGLQGDYFNNTSLSGTPVHTRIDPLVDFNWGEGSPHPLVNPNQFSARWTGQVKSLTAGNYTFIVRHNDGVKLWVNNQQVIYAWADLNGTKSGNIKLGAGVKYDIRLEFYDNQNSARVHLKWSKGTSIPEQVIPTAQLFAPPSTPAPPPPTLMYQGAHEGTNCSTIYGWAADANQPSSSINVDIYDGATLLATVPANQPRTGIPVAGNHGFTYTVPASLKDEQQHTIWVRFSGTSSNLTGSPQSLTCSGATVPDAPSALTAMAITATQINLRWTDNSTNENGFKIERQNPGDIYREIGTVPADVTTYSDLGRSPGITYNYRVSAFNSTGSSAFVQASAMTPGGGPAGPPSAPINVVATVISKSQINLNWTDTSNNEAGFRVLQKKIPSCTSNCAYTIVGTLPKDTTSFQHKNLLPSKQYCYKVEAHNDQGKGTSAVDVCATTLSGSFASAGVALFSGDGAAGSYGYIEGDGLSAKWRRPEAGTVGVDPVSGLTALFVADMENHSIRMIYLEGPAQGHSILIAGSRIAGYWEGDGDPYVARYNYPRGIAAIKNEEGVIDALLIADSGNNTIRLLLSPLGDSRWRPEPFSGFNLTPGYADGTPQDTFFNSPRAITVGNDGFIYVADSSNGAIRRVDWEGNTSTLFRTVTYNGKLFLPIGITSSEVSQWLYITSSQTSISRVQEETLEVLASTTSGYLDGTGGSARFKNPYHLAWVDTGGVGSLYIADRGNYRIRQFDLEANEVTTYAGSGVAGYLNSSTATSARLNSCVGIGIGPSNEIYILEDGNSGVRVAGEGKE